MRKLFLMSAVALGIGGFAGPSTQARAAQLGPEASEQRLLMAADGAIQNSNINQADQYLEQARGRLANDGSFGARQHLALIGQAEASLGQGNTEQAKQYIRLATAAPLVYDPTVEAPLAEEYGGSG